MKTVMLWQVSNCAWYGFETPIDAESYKRLGLVPTFEYWTKYLRLSNIRIKNIPMVCSLDHVVKEYAWLVGDRE